MNLQQRNKPANQYTQQMTKALGAYITNGLPLKLARSYSAQQSSSQSND